MFKNFMHLAFTFILLSTFLVSCKDKSSSGEIPSLGKIKATIEGSKWNGSNASVSMNNYGAYKYVSISANKIGLSSMSSFEFVTIDINSSEPTIPIGVGEYEVSNLGRNAQIKYYNGNSNQTMYKSISGIVSITKFTDKVIQGTFSGTLALDDSIEHTLSILNGGFNVSIPKD